MEAALPPSLPVTTAAAVAVGLSRHANTPSATSSENVAGLRNFIIKNAQPKQSTVCNMSVAACHGRGFMSRIFTLQNVKNNVEMFERKQHLDIGKREIKNGACGHGNGKQPHFQETYYAINGFHR